MSEESLKDKLDALDAKLDDMRSRRRTKKFRVPLRGKVGRSKLKRGFITIVTFDENKNVSFIKKPIIDGTVKIDQTYHAVDEEDIHIFKGKPMIFQPKHRMNPWNPISTVKETYGHKYIMARMKSDIIKAQKSKLGAGVILVILGVIGAGYWFFTQGGGA